MEVKGLKSQIKGELGCRSHCIGNTQRYEKGQHKGWVEEEGGLEG